MIGQTISHYRILHKLGEGGMGVVYLAEDTVLRRQVAVKMLTDTSLGRQHIRTRFLREAIAVSALSHPNIATIYDYGETNEGHPFIVMEYVRGHTLSDLINQRKLTPERAVEIIIDVAQALGEAHRHNIVHRDIKPSNIAVNETGQVKVLDFGLAKQLETAAPADNGNAAAVNTQTREGVILGTPMYASPEQVMGVPVDTRSDLFSLGSVLYESIAGKPPFTGQSPIDICANVIRDDPPPPSTLNPSVSAELDRIVLKSLAKKPDERYQSAELCIEDLRAAVQTLNDLPPPVTGQLSALPAETTEHEPITRGLSRISFSVSRSRLLVLFAVVLAAAGVFVWQATRPKRYALKPELQKLYHDGIEAMHQGAFFRSSKILEQVVQEDTQFALGHARLAETYVELDSSDKALQELLRARELVPDPSDLEKTDRLKWQAVTSVVNRNFNVAVQDYNALLAITPTEERHYALIDLGRAYEKNDQPDKAIESYDEATKLNSNYAGAFLRLGVVHGRLQHWAEAEASFDKASKLFERNSELEGLAEIALQRAVILTQKGQVADARQQLQVALEKSVALQHQDKHIRVLLNLSNNSIVAGKPSEAQQYSSEALTLAQQMKMENLTAQGLIDIGNRYLIKGDLREAESFFNRGLTLAQHYKAERSEARAFISLSSLKTHQNEPDAAMDYFHRALPFYKRGGYRKELAQAYTMFGHALDQSGQYDSALRIFGEQLDAANQANDSQQRAWAHEGHGVVFNHLQRYPEALSQFQEQYKLAKSLATNVILGYSAMNIGTMSWQIGDYETAEARLNEAMQIAESKGEQLKELKGWIHVSRAQMLLSRLDYGRAISEAEQALSIAGAESKHIAIQAKSALGLAQVSTGVSSGLKNCEEAVTLAKTLKDPLPLSRALLVLAQAELSAKRFRRGLERAVEAQQLLATAQNHESEWRAWFVQAKATESLGGRRLAREPAARSSAMLQTLEQQWPSTYRGRPDVQQARNQLDRLLQEK